MLIFCLGKVTSVLVSVLKADLYDIISKPKVTKIIKFLNLVSKKFNIKIKYKNWASYLI